MQAKLDKPALLSWADAYPAFDLLAQYLVLNPKVFYLPYKV